MAVTFGCSAVELHGMGAFQSVTCSVCIFALLDPGDKRERKLLVLVKINLGPLFGSGRRQGSVKDNRPPKSMHPFLEWSMRVAPLEALGL